ncbi:recombinase RecT [Buttiauxella sp. B2]|uniref:RecT family recombinase n=1 Tax=Buttiauxella sp. B2 TaxID=2587812 RepID=UPI001121CB89|nr:RecT family recombinase [Buttiauxella sp. B2]TNV22099.1 recombinase RecT [Buttiauxella sp. B2]
MSQLTTTEKTNAVMNNVSMLFSENGMERMIRFAELMASGAATVPRHLQGKTSDCLAITMQSMRWGMDPFVVGQKTHLINGVLGYEAQLVNAVVTSSTAVQGRFHYEYGGEWERIVGQPMDKRDETGLFVRVGAILRGESEITWGEPLYLVEATTRNSPLWKSKPKQQIAYLAVKYWARLYCPEVILGVYTPDEVEVRTEREINPTGRTARASISDMARNGKAAETFSADQKPIEGELNKGEPTDDQAVKMEAEYLEQIELVETCEKATEIRSAIEENKAVLGRSRYTALKGKAVAKYHHIDARNAVEASINSLEVGSEFAESDFKRTEQLLASRRNHLGQELYDAFMITMNDLRPEFQQ